MLYEVITGVKFLVDQRKTYQGNHKDRLEYPEPSTADRTEFPDHKEADRKNEKGIVITSYSIHYTKLYDGGVIVKILDAMSAGVAVVTTPYGNEGIRAKEGLEILVADRPEAFADEVVRLLRDVGLRTAVGDAGKRFIEENFRTDVFV